MNQYGPDRYATDKDVQLQPMEALLLGFVFQEKTDPAQNTQMDDS